MILYEIVPYCKSELLKQINSSPFFSLLFDKSLNSMLQKCQMDVNIRFWNNETNILETRYLYSQFLERPNADNLFQIIKDSTSGLNEANLLQLAMDGPDVNWLVLNKLDDMLIANGHEKTVNISSCPQHRSWWLPNWNFKRWLEH